MQFTKLADPSRLEVLREAVLPQSPPGGSFRHLTSLVVKVLHVPTAMVTFVDAEREIIESGTGAPEPWASEGGFPLEYSFCKHVVASGEPLLIEDARKEEAVRDNPAIREMRAVAYAGIPVRAPDGQVLGALCALDHFPRTWTADEVEVLTELCQAIQHEIDQRVALRTERGEREEMVRKFEAELREASSFRALVENSLAGIYLVQDDRVRYANPRLREIFGYAPDERLPDMRVSDFAVEEDRERVAEGVRQRMSGEVDRLQYTFRGVRKDGAIVHVEVLGSRTEVDGRPAIIGTLLDVTQRVHAEEKLREAAERMRLVERATEDVIWEWSVPTGQVRWNEAGPRMFRYKPEEVGSTIEWHQEHIHPEDREAVVRSLQSILGGVGEFWSGEYRFRRGDGHYVTVLDRGYVQRDERGEPVRVIGSMMDVTERRREEESQRFLARASALLDSSLDHESILASLARLCIPLLGDYCLVDLSEDTREVRRVATAHVDPRKEDRLFRGTEGEEHRLPADHPIMKTFRTGEPVFLPVCDDAQLEALGYDEEEREAIGGPDPCSLIVAPLCVGDRKLGAITLGISESGRQYTPVDLLLVQDLARRTALSLDHALLYHRATDAVRARDEVLGVVSHDLRNPLSAIQMSAAMLRDVGQERRAENQRWLDMITQTADRMNTLIDDLLDVSRMEAGRFSVQPTDRSVAALVRDACDLLEPLAREKEITLRTRIAEELSTVWTDPHQILRVISNLVGNAIKFTPAGGEVALEVERKGGDVLFSVKDTGPGIPRAQLPHVFDRFWQGRRGDRRGAGLGLAIARGIVEAHGGRIWAESTEGEGATFYFTVPAEGAAREE